MDVFPRPTVYCDPQPLAIIEEQKERLDGLGFITTVVFCSIDLDPQDVWEGHEKRPIFQFGIIVPVQTTDDPDEVRRKLDSHNAAIGNKT